MIALEPHVQAVLASTPLDSLSTKSLRTRLESRLGLKSGALKERKHEISRLLTAARDQPAGAPSAAPSAALSAAPPLARLVAPPKRCARRAMFCDCCGALLREPTQTGTSVECHLCGAGVDAAEFEALVVTTAGKDHVLGANLARGGVQADTSVPPPVASHARDTDAATRLRPCTLARPSHHQPGGRPTAARHGQTPQPAPQGVADPEASRPLLRLPARAPSRMRRRSELARSSRRRALSAPTRSCSTTRCSCAAPTRGRRFFTSARSAATRTRQTPDEDLSTSTLAALQENSMPPYQ